MKHFILSLSILVQSFCLVAQSIEFSYFGGNTKPLLPIVIVDTTKCDSISRRDNVRFECIDQNTFLLIHRELLKLLQESTHECQDSLFNVLTIRMIQENKEAQEFKFQCENPEFKMIIRQVDILLSKYELNTAKSSWKFYKESANCD